MIEDLSTHLGNLEYGYEKLIKKVIQVSDTEVVAGISTGEIGSRVFAVEGQISELADYCFEIDARRAIEGNAIFEDRMVGDLLIWKGDHKDLSSSYLEFI
ncbi:hypothetical protein Tco_0299798 [Tanacetum coccineum]